MSLVAVRRGRAAPNLREKMLIELEKAGLLEFIGYEVGRPSTYAIRINGKLLRPKEVEVAPMCIGIALGVLARGGPQMEYTLSQIAEPDGPGQAAEADGT